MPWARIPCDKLAGIAVFGYTLEKQDGNNLWYRGPDGQLTCVDKYAPRFWFESKSDAMQAGSVAIRIKSEVIEDDEAEEEILSSEVPKAVGGLN